jgi:hypothetical protein
MRSQSATMRSRGPKAGRRTAEPTPEACRSIASVLPALSLRWPSPRRTEVPQPGRWHSGNDPGLRQLPAGTTLMRESRDGRLTLMRASSIRMQSTGEVSGWDSFHRRGVGSWRKLRSSQSLQLSSSRSAARPSGVARRDGAARQFEPVLQALQTVKGGLSAHPPRLIRGHWMTLSDIRCHRR